MDRESEAEKMLSPGAFGYFAGGAGDERVLRDNVAAWDRYRLAPRVLVDVSRVDASVELLGQRLEAPILVAPMAYQRHAHRLGELAMARAVAGAGLGMVVSSQTTTHPADVGVAAGNAPRWFQLYVMKDLGVSIALMDAARDLGYSAVVLTVDFPVGGQRRRDADTGFTVTEPTFMDQLHGVGARRPMSPRDRHAQHDPTLTWADLPVIAEHTGLPLVLKGILRPDDAMRAVEVGASAIIVSNHGGRQLDATLATADALGPIVDAVGGRIPVLVDGGIRRGTDIAVALALGASAVLVGRPALWGLVVNGQEGARQVLDELKAELDNTLALIGSPRARDLGPSFLAGYTEPTTYRHRG